jgi:hypothetical protein
MATVYISATGGASTQDGLTADTAYAIGSLSTAESDAGSGGTIYFLDGNYFTTNQTLDAMGVTYQALNKHLAVLGPATAGSTSMTTLTLGDSTSTANTAFKDFSVRNYKPSLKAPTSGSVTLTVQGCYIQHTEGKDMATQGVANITPLNGNVKIYDCVFAPRQSHNRTENIIMGTGGNVAFERNTVYYRVVGTHGNAINLSQLTSLGSLKNSIFQGVIEGTGSFQADNAAVNAVNCCFHDFGAPSGGTNNVFADPQFIDVANDDLRLRPSSPCINAGT